MFVELLSITDNPELLIEKAGRTAYLSYENLKENSHVKFIKNLIKNEHFSVIEHAYATFRIFGASRVFTHQLVRHRLCSFTQQSQRFVNEEFFNLIEPESIKQNHITHKLFQNHIEDTKKLYLKLQELGIKNEDARFILPNAIESQIVITANFREWRHIIELRGSQNSQWEIRNVIIEILRILKQKAPNVFSDFIIDDELKFIKKINLE